MRGAYVGKFIATDKILIKCFPFGCHKVFVVLFDAADFILYID